MGAEIDGIVAQALRESGKLRDARELLDRALASTDPLRADQRAILELNLGSIELAIGHGAAATTMFQRARDRVIGAYGDRHPDIAIYDDKLAATATARGNIRDALALERESLELRMTAFGDDDRATATTYLQRARTELEAGELDTADTDLHRARDIRTRVFGERSPRLGEIDAALGDVATARGDFAAAKTLYVQAHDLDARLELTARMWFATVDGKVVSLDAIPTLAPGETLTVDRVTALYVRANMLLAQLVPEDIMQVAYGVGQRWSADFDPAMMVAIARVEYGGGYRDKAADHFAAALARSGDEPTRTQLDAASGLAQCDDKRAPQAARTAISLYQAMPQLARTATYALMLKLSKT